MPLLARCPVLFVSEFFRYCFISTYFYTCNFSCLTVVFDSIRLKKDRERQEQLARERLEARRNARKKKEKIEEDPEPEKGKQTNF